MEKEKVDENKIKIKNFGRLLIVILVFLLLIPTVLCIVLFIKYKNLSDEIDRIRQLKMERILVAQKRSSEAVMIDSMLSFAKGQADKRQALILQAKEEKMKTAKGRVYLTFDDGPSPNTDSILRILRENDIKATFFVIGRTDERALDGYRRIVKEGHTIALHSYTHDYGLIYASLDNFKKDYYAVSDLIFKTTGVRCKYYRFPGGSSNTVSKIDMHKPADFLKQEGIKYFDWNVMSGDAVKNPPSPGELYTNVMTGVRKMGNSVVLMHDSFGKKSTVKALPKIIKSLKKENYLILPIDDSTPVVHHNIKKSVHNKVKENKKHKIFGGML